MDLNLYNSVVSFVRRHNKASVSHIQRNFNLGYNRASEIMDKLENEHVVSCMYPSGRREVYPEIVAKLTAEINDLKAKLEKLEKSKSGIVLTCSQLLEAFQFGAPDGESDADQMATEMAIKWFNDGHSGAGYYCYYSDYPEEGAIFLGEEAAQEKKNEKSDP